MSVKHTELSLKLERHGYHPGEKLVGQVGLKVLSSTKFVNLRVEVYGVELTEVDRSYVVAAGWYSGAHLSEVSQDFWYYRHVCTLDGHTLKSGEKWGLLLPEGERTYDFSIDLPHDLPPSFHGGDGTNDQDFKREHADAGATSKMQYVACAVLEYEDHTYELAKHQLDMLPEPLNASQHDNSPQGLVIRKNFNVKRLLLLDGGKVSIQANIARTLLSPGIDTLVVPLEVDLKECNGELVKSRLSLVRKVHVHAKSESDIEVQSLATSKWVEKQIAAKASGAFDIELDVPKNLPPSLHLVGTTLYYEAEIELNMKGCEDIKYCFPVTIAPAEIDKTNSSFHFSSDLHVVAKDKKQFAETVCFKPKSRPTSRDDLSAAH